ncbi:glutathione-disulfide reductase [Solimonas terrae]|uniref:Glutathione-disulfide reductase n=1 Tax=Solimonas terrae TaxID=1396819 RepID=A0A6M2BVU9_9GAMM|nr:glutathione-disulfide reductase [Solimonas terrae]NGY06385.1 glutathione-disulfide reductase [Solimonas terrae]
MSIDVDLLVIGAGSGGVRAARVAAGFGARVAIAESRELGGTCVNLGCVPKKLFVYGASYADDFAHASSYGWHGAAPAFDWPTLRDNKNREIARINAVYGRLLADAGARLIRGHARLLDGHTAEIGGERIRAAHILIATGCAPDVPDIPGAEHAITSDDAFHLPRLPRRVIVSGGGYIAVEFASIFHGLGVQVTQLYRGERFLRGFDDGIREHLRAQLCLRGIDLQFQADIARIERRADGVLVAHLCDGRALETDCVMFATGRRPPAGDGLGLASTRARRKDRGFIEVDDDFRTAEPSILAVGDVVGRVQLTPVALAEGTAVARQLFRPDAYRRLDYELIPTAVFSLPNIGTVGLSEAQARERGHALQIFESRFKSLKLTLTDSQERTYMKLVVDADSGRVLGAHMVGPDAGEIIQGIAIALRAGATKQVFDDTLGIHPSTAEEFVTMRTPRLAPA